LVWRALLNGSDVPAEALEPMGHTQWVGPGCHLLAYYIRRGKLVNIVTQEDTDKWVEEGWSTRGDPDEMRLSFPNPEPRLAKLLRLVTECSKWGLFKRPLTRNWGRGRISLIGLGPRAPGAPAGPEPDAAAARLTVAGKFRMPRIAAIVIVCCMATAGFTETGFAKSRLSASSVSKAYPRGGSMLDKPTFGEKFKMSAPRRPMRAQHYHDEFVTMPK
jgi:hypothetical protein